VRSPTFAVEAFFHPNQPTATFLAKISPNPSITPFIKGRSRFTASDEANAKIRVRVDNDESKTDRVTDTGGFDADGSAGGGGVASNEREGKEEATEGTSSHFCSSSTPASARECMCVEGSVGTD